LFDAAVGRSWTDTPPSSNLSKHFSIQHCAVPRASASRFEADLKELLKVVHYGHRPRPSLLDASYRERYDVAGAPIRR
jgi:hypothetical protein